jgi:hypothetical protein
MTIIQIALRMNLNPEDVERMDAYWYNRLLIYFNAEVEAEKIK